MQKIEIKFINLTSAPFYKSDVEIRTEMASMLFARGLTDEKNIMPIRTLSEKDMRDISRQIKNVLFITEETNLDDKSQDMIINYYKDEAPVKPALGQLPDPYFVKLRELFGEDLDFEQDVTELETTDTQKLFLIYHDYQNSATLIRLLCGKADTTAKTKQSDQIICLDRPMYENLIKILKSVI